MPAQQGLGLHEEHGLPPGPHAGGQYDQQRTIRGRAVDALHAALRHDKLLAQQGVLGDERAFAARQVGQRVHNEACGRGRSDCQQATTERLQQPLAEVTDIVEEGRTHEAPP